MKLILILAITLVLSQAAVQNCNCGTKQGLDAAKKCADPTVPDCESAAQTDNAKCDRCKEATYPDDDAAATKCTAIGADKVEGCKYYNKDKKCTACASGKALGSDGKCGNEIANCISYSGASTALKCEMCKNEMKIKSDKSVCEAGTEVKDCASYGAPATAPVCIVCKPKFYLSSKECKAVKTVDNCKNYKSDADECGMCNFGYFLENKACVKFTVDKCVMGTAKDKCTHCDGIAPKADGTACDVKVDPVDANCMGYDKDKKCGSCKDGYGADKDSKCTVKCPTSSGGGGGGSDASILKALVLPIVLLVALLI